MSKINIVIDTSEKPIYVTDCNEKVEYYSLEQSEKIIVCDQVKKLQEKLDWFKSYIGYQND